MMRMLGLRESGGLSQDQMRGLLEVCDPAGTGLVSIDYLTTLASQHYKTKEEAERIVRRLDPRGRGVLSYKEFCIGVNTIFRKAGARDIMMAPSVEQRCTTAGGGGVANTDNSKTGTNNAANIFLVTSNNEMNMGAESNDKLNSRCSSMSECESYECYGEVDMDTSTPNLAGGDVLQRSPNGNSLRRNTWLRTSLRRTPNNHETLPNRRWGSFRHTSGKRLAPNNLGSTQLHRSSSFNSSGRSSNCDTADDVYSDVSLEEDVLDLNHKVQMLQQQMNVLADNQNHTDERYTRAKQENATLQARVHMLEEQLREVELRAEERLAEEERRHRELVARVDREKQLQVENCAIRLQTLELENSSLKDEATRCRTQADKLKSEKQKLEEHARENDCTISLLKEEILLLREQEHRYKENSNANQQLIEELSLEVERLRSEQNQALAELSIRSIGISETAHEELQAQFTSLRDENRRLQEAHDEMQAIMLTRSVEEGRSLLTGGAHNKGSLAAELEAMSQDELGDLAREELKVRTALKEQQEVNAQLRAYIDGILLNIVENYPQLLEVKAASA